MGKFKLELIEERCEDIKDSKSGKVGHRRVDTYEYNGDDDGIYVCVEEYKRNYDDSVYPDFEITVRCDNRSDGKEIVEKIRDFVFSLQGGV